MPEKPQRTLKPKWVWIGLGGTVVLLLIFYTLQWCESVLLDLPAQYLLFALFPMVVGLICGGYITKFEAAGVGAEFASTSDILRKSQAIQDPNGVAKAPDPPQGSWQEDRAKEYERTRGYMLAHVYRPSAQAGQKYDISIFVVRHKKGTATPPESHFEEIFSAEFFFGPSWQNKIFKVLGDNGFFGVRTHAWGTFLATCKLTFKDNRTVVLHRYIDFSMAAKEE